MTPWMPAWTTGTALVTPSAIQLMPPVMAGLTLSSTLASVKPSDMIASLNSCAVICPSAIASRKLPV